MNADRARRTRKKVKDRPARSQATKYATAPAVISAPRTLSRVLLEGTPDKAVWEIFEDDDVKFKLLRQFVSKVKRLPTREQMQSFAKAAKETIASAQVVLGLKES